MYVLGNSACPFSKLFIADTAQCVFTSRDRLEEIRDLADGAGLHVYTLPDEADTIVEAVIKNRNFGAASRTQEALCNTEEGPALPPDAVQ